MIRHTPWAAPPYDFSIGLKPIDEAAWLEGGAREAQRKTALRDLEGDKVWGETNGSRPGQSEALALIEAATGARAEGGQPPLWAASLLTADDLCLMERRGGAWSLSALSLCSPGYFTAAEVLGRSLARLHGPVPGFDERFLARVERIFTALQPDTILERRNWTVTATSEPYLPSAGPVRALAAAVSEEDAGRRLFIRVERQTIRRLPESGGVLFTIRVWFNPLEDLRAQPGAMEAFARAWRGADPAYRTYKGLALYDSLIEAFLASG